MIDRAPPERKRITALRSRYRELSEVGCGTFGKVYMATCNGRNFAIKKYTYSNQPIHLTTIREIKALRMLSSPYIISIEEIVVEKYQIWVVFPFFPNDLSRLILNTPLTLDNCRSIFWQILKGVQYMHGKGIMHRDLKTANILVDRASRPAGAGQPAKRRCVEGSGQDACGLDAGGGALGGAADTDAGPEGAVGAGKRDFHGSFIIKICDFGMAKTISKDMTPGVVTLWYRAPELLLGCTRYGPAVDTWSLGCILFEMLKMAPLFKGTTEVEQLDLITKYCGTIDKSSMPKCESYSLFSKYNLEHGERCLAQKFQSLPSDALDLIDRMLVLDPAQRIAISDCLSHPFFTK